MRTGGGVRFLLYDRVTAIERGRTIAGTVSFPLSADIFEHHFPRLPVVPGTLLIESMVQLVGWGIIHAHDFRLRAIMSLVEGVTCHEPQLRPGALAVITGEIVATSASDSLGRAAITVDGRPVAAIERIIYTHVPSADREELVARFRYLSGLSLSEIEAGGTP
jgi:3-hydroxyacyl-[acyl-carrier-protein] dehydratase